METIRIKCSSFKKVDTPMIIGKENYVKHVATVNIKDLPDALENRRDINVRDARLGSIVSGKIFESLLNDPDMFFLKNRGITLLAEETKFDNKTNEVIIKFDDPSMHGLLDGGHTFSVIRQYLDVTSVDGSAADAYVSIEIITGVDDMEDIVGIVEARNTSTQVKDETLEELRGSYDAIHNILDNTKFGKRIHYSEYEIDEEGYEKDIDIKDILSYLVCFDVESFDDSKHPVKAYSSKKGVIAHFRDRQEDGSMLKYIPLLPKILQLYDVIYRELPTLYNNTGGNFGNLTGVTKITSDSRRSPVELKFIGDTSSYVIPKGFIYPILASFRNLIKVKNGFASWKSDPVLSFLENGEDLAERVVEVAKIFFNPNKLGKHLPVWRSCYDSIEKTIR